MARFIEVHAADGVTTTRLWDELEDVPCTQATVALEFVKDRGSVDVERRRCYLTSNCFFEDALCEWHALAYHCKTEMES